VPHVYPSDDLIPTLFVRYRKSIALLGLLSLTACAPVDEPAEGAVFKADLSGAAPDSAKRFTKYIALGDSFVSGDGVSGATTGCKVSTLAYPWLLNSKLAEGGTMPELTVEGCSGHTTVELTSTQLGSLRAADANTLITVTIGGNDADTVWEMGRCLLSNCEARGPVIAKQINDTVAPRLNALFKRIKDESNGATVVVTGYPLLVMANAHKQPVCSTMLTAKEVKMIQSSIKLMNSKIKAASESNGFITVVDELQKKFVNHEACAPQKARWINGGEWTDGNSGVLHPNEPGNQAYADVIAAALKRSGIAVSRVLDTPTNSTGTASPQTPGTTAGSTPGSTTGASPAPKPPTTTPGSTAGVSPTPKPATAKPSSTAGVAPKPGTTGSTTGLPKPSTATGKEPTVGEEAESDGESTEELEDIESDDSEDEDTQSDDIEDEDTESADSEDEDIESADSEGEDTESDDIEDEDTESADSEDEDTETSDSEENEDLESPDESEEEVDESTSDDEESADTEQEDESGDEGAGEDDGDVSGGEEEY
jgi:lysophospholipase L1-like esterase